MRCIKVLAEIDTLYITLEQQHCYLSSWMDRGLENEERKKEIYNY